MLQGHHNGRCGRGRLDFLVFWCFGIYGASSPSRTFPRLLGDVPRPFPRVPSHPQEPTRGFSDPPMFPILQARVLLPLSRGLNHRLQVCEHFRESSCATSHHPFNLTYTHRISRSEAAKKPEIYCTGT